MIARGLERALVIAGRFFAVFAWLFLTACAGPETLRLREERTSADLVGVPFFAQDAYQCGPAALATVLAASGVSVSPDDLVDEVYVPARQGSFQAEMIASARRRDRVPYVLERTIDAAISELRAGRPVLVFQNLGASRWPVWHYAVIVGFDAEHQVFILNSGTQEKERVSARSFLRSWDRAGRWMMVVTDAETLPASAAPLAWLRSAAPFESVGSLDIALQAYRTATLRWPDVAPTWAALGNALAKSGDFSQAAHAYERAIALDEGAALIRNNYAWTLAQMGCSAQANAQLDAALLTADPQQRELLESTRAGFAVQTQPADVCPL